MEAKQENPLEQLMLKINEVLAMSKSQEATAKLFAESAAKIDKQDS